MARGRGKGRRGGGRGRPGREEEGSGSEEEFDYRPQRGQAATVGMLPPSDSEEDSDEEDAPRGGQNPNVGELPPSSSEEEGSSEDESGSEGEEGEQQKVPRGRPAVPAEAPRRRKDEDGPDPEQMRKDMERLALIRQKRETERQARIAAEGWDRFAPISETNKPPVPKDHPSVRPSSSS